MSNERCEDHYHKLGVIDVYLRRLVNDDGYISYLPADSDEVRYIGDFGHGRKCLSFSRKDLEPLEYEQQVRDLVFERNRAPAGGDE